MKYYIGKIEELNGDFEYRDTYLFKTEGDPHEFTDNTASEWRSGTKWDADQEGWWCEHTLIFNDGFKEVSKEDFDVLCKYIVVL
jgi:hypothetical protein